MGEDSEQRRHVGKIEVVVGRRFGRCRRLPAGADFPQYFRGTCAEPKLGRKAEAIPYNCRVVEHTRLPVLVLYRYVN